MCGSYSLEQDEPILMKRFSAAISFEYRPLHHIFPSSLNPVITQDNQNEFEAMRWGMTPTWWSIKGRSLINVRVETLKEKRTFSRHLLERRVLVPATSFYEWKLEGKEKSPYRIQLDSGDILAFAGLYEVDEVNGIKIPSYSIITTEPNSLMLPIHDRMPAILRKEDEKAWLDPGTSQQELFNMLTPLPASSMKAYKVEKKLAY